MTEQNEGKTVQQHQYFVLGVEGGATKTEWIYLRCYGGGGGGSSRTNTDWEVLQQGRLPAANFKLISRHDLIHLFTLLPQNADRVGIYLPGVLDLEDNRILHHLASGIWPEASITTGSDRDSGLAAAFGKGAGILVISGTGSSMTGRRDGQIQKAGGKGHLVGDKGSAYHVAMEALRLVMDRYDETEKPCRLAEAILRELGLDEVDDIIDWVQGADKPTIARLATVVFEVHRKEGDSELLDILRSGVEALAHATTIVAKRLTMCQPTVALQGSMFTKQELYVELYKMALHRKLPQAKVLICQDPGSLGAARLAIGQTAETDMQPKAATDKKLGHSRKKLLGIISSLTDEHNNRPLDVDQMNAKELVDLLIDEEKRLHETLFESKATLNQAIEMVTQVLKNGGHLIFVGTGPSVRSGVLNATEIVRSFGEPTDTIHAFIAEVNDEDQVKGVRRITEKEVTKADLVCGIITSSDKTSFVVEALDEAKRIGATTALLTNNCGFSTKGKYGFEINFVTDARQPHSEGSIRTDDGRTIKTALNIITTGAVILLKNVKSNLAASLRSSNVKVKGRVIRSVAQLTGHSYEETHNELQQRYDWDILSLMNNIKRN